MKLSEMINFCKPSAEGEQLHWSEKFYKITSGFGKSLAIAVINGAYFWQAFLLDFCLGFAGTCGRAFLPLCNLHHFRSCLYCYRSCQQG